MLTEAINRALNDPDTSYWLKATMLDALKRDPVDAANEADMLALLLRSRADAMLRGQTPRSLYMAVGELTE
jgi:hypothetical protein